MLQPSAPAQLRLLMQRTLSLGDSVSETATGVFPHVDDALFSATTTDQVLRRCSRALTEAVTVER
jgi:hypothetical protein